VAAEIEDVSAGMDATPIGRIPFDEAVVDALAEGVPLVEWNAGTAARAVEDIWGKLISAASLASEADSGRSQ
jgi:MinD-like ATPase involved in chromosome partitioning or flagellar assembly